MMLWLEHLALTVSPITLPDWLMLVTTDPTMILSRTLTTHPHGSLTALGASMWPTPVHPEVGGCQAAAWRFPGHQSISICQLSVTELDGQCEERWPPAFGYDMESCATWQEHAASLRICYNYHTTTYTDVYVYDIYVSNSFLFFVKYWVIWHRLE